MEQDWIDRSLGEFVESLLQTFLSLWQNIKVLSDDSLFFSRLNWAIVIFSFFLLIFLIVLLFKTVFALKAHQKQRSEFLSIVNTLRNVSELPESNGTKNQLNSDNIKNLLNQCEKLGKKIDSHTDRKGNSRRVSTLVYKICTAEQFSASDCFLYFCASLVYDAGFLDVNGYLFKAEVLSANEKLELKTHVMRGNSFLDFAPQDAFSVFWDAAALHHENMDGSGYPEGLKGEEIPIIARIIHVVESFVSLTSHRSYHKKLDKNAALAELKSLPKMYDAKIVSILESLV